MSNGLIEAIHGLIQLAKRMARAFRSFRYLRIAAFLKADKLTLDVPALPTENSEEAFFAPCLPFPRLLSLLAGSRLDGGEPFSKKSEGFLHNAS
ncbi:hypothetical protein MAMC_00116 [Methylacidimicrobium cyclopophantes]|uniref:Transposase IS204/IS1001/IS1096/IS1165 DDE domain-containing protein n=1 Tax=Methylacidimicrobium cyclopophantes TaxID=1041766 RepID=A0A5E6M4Q1_9BACT|nr:hypothetical protein MAMC_00116 [Methylacidimicrobium cyclopophantes]